MSDVKTTIESFCTMLESVGENKGYVFDFDDTLAKTNARILVVKDGEVTQKLAPQIFNTYKLKDGETFDFSDFDNPTTLRQAKKLKIWKVLQNVENTLSSGQTDSQMYILTARSENIKDAIHEFLISNGIKSIGIDEIFTVGDNKEISSKDKDLRSIAERKKEVLSQLRRKHSGDIVFFDDDQKNIELALEVPGIKTRLVKEELEESILDEPRKTMDSAIWDLQSDDLVLKSNVHDAVVDGLIQLVGDVPIKQVYIVGSLTGTRYNTDADLDVSVLVDADDETKSHLGKRAVEINGKFAPGTEHPINYFVMNQDVGTDRFDSVYDFQQDKWIKLPKDHGVDLFNVYDEFRQYIKNIDMDKDEALRSLIDIEILISALQTGGDAKIIFDKIQQRFRSLDYSVRDLATKYDDVHKSRIESFLNYEGGDKKGLPSPNLLPANIRYKLLERYHYLDFMHQLKKLVDVTGDIDTMDDLEKVKSIVTEEIIQEASFGIDKYKVPHQDRQKMMMDFYFLTGVYLSIPEVMKGVDSTELQSAIDFALEKIVNFVQKDLGAATFFSICAEIRHVFDSNRYDTLNTIIEKNPSGTQQIRVRTVKTDADDFNLTIPWNVENTKHYQEMFKKYTTTYAGLKDYDAGPSRERLMQYGDVGIKKGSSTNFIQSWKSAKNASKGDNVDFAELAKMFYLKAQWSSAYGGDAWAGIAHFYIEVAKSKTLKEKIANIDKLFSLQHNTGTVLNKVQEYSKNGGFDWISKALDFKFNVRDFWEYKDQVSSGLSQIVAATAKAIEGKSKTETEKDELKEVPKVGDKVRHEDLGYLGGIDVIKILKTSDPKRGQLYQLKNPETGKMFKSFEDKLEVLSDDDIEKIQKANAKSSVDKTEEIGDDLSIKDIKNDEWYIFNGIKLKPNKDEIRATRIGTHNRVSLLYSDLQGVHLLIKDFTSKDLLLKFIYTLDNKTYESHLEPEELIIVASKIKGKKNRENSLKPSDIKQDSLYKFNGNSYGVSTQMSAKNIKIDGQVEYILYGNLKGVRCFVHSISDNHVTLIKFKYNKSVYTASGFNINKFANIVDHLISVGKKDNKPSQTPQVKREDIKDGATFVFNGLDNQGEISDKILSIIYPSTSGAVSNFTYQELKGIQLTILKAHGYISKIEFDYKGDHYVTGGWSLDAFQKVISYVEETQQATSLKKSYTVKPDEIKAGETYVFNGNSDLKVPNPNSKVNITFPKESDSFLPILYTDLEGVPVKVLQNKNYIQKVEFDYKGKHYVTGGWSTNCFAQCISHLDTKNDSKDIIIDVSNYNKELYQPEADEIKEGETYVFSGFNSLGFENEGNMSVSGGDLYSIPFKELRGIPCKLVKFDPIKDFIPEIQFLYHGKPYSTGGWIAKSFSNMVYILKPKDKAKVNLPNLSNDRQDDNELSKDKEKRVEIGFDISKGDLNTTQQYVFNGKNSSGLIDYEDDTAMKLLASEKSNHREKKFTFKELSGIPVSIDKIHQDYSRISFKFAGKSYISIGWTSTSLYNFLSYPAQNIEDSKREKDKVQPDEMREGKTFVFNGLNESGKKNKDIITIIYPEESDDDRKIQYKDLKGIPVKILKTHNYEQGHGGIDKVEFDYKGKHYVTGGWIKTIFANMVYPLKDNKKILIDNYGNHIQIGDMVKITKWKPFLKLIGKVATLQNINGTVLKLKLNEPMKLNNNIPSDQLIITNFGNNDDQQIRLLGGKYNPKEEIDYTPFSELQKGDKVKIVQWGVGSTPQILNQTGTFQGVKNGKSSGRQYKNIDEDYYVVMLDEPISVSSNILQDGKLKYIFFPYKEHQVNDFNPKENNLVKKIPSKTDEEVESFQKIQVEDIDITQLQSTGNLDEYFVALESIMNKFEFTGGKMNLQKTAGMKGQRVDRGSRGSLNSRRMSSRERNKRALGAIKSNIKTKARGKLATANKKKIIGQKLNPNSNTRNF